MRLLRALFTIALLLPAGAAQADAFTFMRVGSQWVTDPAFDLFSTSDALPSVVLGAGWAASDTLELELGWAFTGSNAESFDVIDASLFLHQIQGAARVRLLGDERFHLAARGGAGFAMAHADVDGETELDGGAVLEDSAYGLALEGTLLLEVRVPISLQTAPHAVAFGFSLEAGYGWHPLGLDFGEARVSEQDGADGQRPIRSGPIALGTLNPSGPILRIGLGLHF